MLQAILPSHYLNKTITQNNMSDANRRSTSTPQTEALRSQGTSSGSGVLPESFTSSLPKADTTGPVISQSPSGALINEAGVENFDKKYKGPAVLASGEQVPATGYNTVGEPLITGPDGKEYRASKTTHS